jgi:hypothetical protein
MRKPRLALPPRWRAVDVRVPLAVEMMSRITVLALSRPT